MVKSFFMSLGTECSFCYMPMKAGEVVTVLGCHEKHFNHKECYDTYVEVFKRTSSRLLCPLCRAPVVNTKEKTISAVPAPDSALKVI